MGCWIELSGEALSDYLSGYLIPLDAREAPHGVEVWMPHDPSFPCGICSRCRVMLQDYEKFEIECRGD